MWSKLFLVACLVVAANAGAASFIKKCQTEDYKCQKESSQAALSVFVDGIPELGIEKLDPLHYEKMDASSNDLKLMMTDIKISGVKNCQIKKVLRDVPNSKLFFKALCTVSLDGQYEMNGRLLVLPIRGKGKVAAVLKKVLISVDADVVDQTGKDNKKHWNIKSWKFSYELLDKAVLELENLFEGNELLAATVNQLLKSSPNEVINEVGSPIIKSLLTKVIKDVNKFFKQVPVEDLVLD